MFARQGTSLRKPLHLPLPSLAIQALRPPVPPVLRWLRRQLRQHDPQASDQPDLFIGPLFLGDDDQFIEVDQAQVFNRLPDRAYLDLVQSPLHVAGGLPRRLVAAALTAATVMSGRVATP